MGAVVQEEHFTPEQVAGRYGFAADTVRHWIRRGVTVFGKRVRLHALRVGRSLRVPHSSLDAFLAELNPPAPEGPSAESGAARRATLRAAQEQLDQLHKMLAPRGRKGAEA